MGLTQTFSPVRAIARGVINEQSTERRPSDRVPTGPSRRQLLIAGAALITAPVMREAARSRSSTNVVP